MKQDRLIVSVPHSGTRFFEQRLGWYDHRHTFGWFDRLLTDIAAYDGKVLVPLRHPQDVLRSWAARQRNYQSQWLSQFSIAWTYLDWVVRIYDAEVWQVEKQDHPLITDWTPVGNKDRKTAKPESVETIMDYTDISPVFALPLIQNTDYEFRPLKRPSRRLY